MRPSQPRAKWLHWVSGRLNGRSGSSSQIVNDALEERLLAIVDEQCVGDK